MGRSFWGWVSWFVFLFALDFIVPFKILKDSPTLMASFLFWVLWVIVAIVSMFIIFLRWQENE
jgi:hypothetical protein